MTATLEATTSDQTVFSGEHQFATFHVGDMILGIDIRLVQEINRQIDVTATVSAL